MVRRTAAALACVLAMPAPAIADTHDEGEGRLSANSGGGGFVAAAPVHRDYWVSLGDWVLCDTALNVGPVDDKITITGLRFVTGRYRPLAVRAYIRKVTPRQVAAHPGQPAGAYSPFTSNLGSAPKFQQPYADRDWTPRGHFSRGVAGSSVLRGCDQALEDAYADLQGEVPLHPWTSLVLAVKVGRHGARIRRTLVDYEDGTGAHTLRIRWTVGGQRFHGG
ncbi:MAG: hypothetical protein U0R80_16080 [Nocardioidaceae bacterium]